jgi:hypothetical protein
MAYRGTAYTPSALDWYPDAKGIPFTDTANITPMTGSLWTPAQLIADFQRRMASVRSTDRKKGIIVMLKSERCCTKGFRACTVTTAALEKRSTPLIADFLIYGAWIKPRDGDNPPGSLNIETGADSWKNEAAREYQFMQGPGATLVFINPDDGSKIERTDALELDLFEKPFLANEGRTPKLEAELGENPDENGFDVMMNQIDEVAKGRFGYRTLRELDRIPTPVQVVSPASPSLASGEKSRTVVVDLYIDEEGRVCMPSVSRADVGTAWAAFALDAVKQWRFEPPLYRGRPTLALVRQNFNFVAKQ